MLPAAHRATSLPIHNMHGSTQTSIAVRLSNARRSLTLLFSSGILCIWPQVHKKVRPVRAVRGSKP
jgi:hypothetical protein